MGMLRIIASGSFNPRIDKTFKAQTSGHAVAVADAIKYLQEAVLPAVIRQDQMLQAEGHAPDDGFVEAVNRGFPFKTGESCRGSESQT